MKNSPLTPLCAVMGLSLAAMILLPSSPAFSQAGAAPAAAAAAPFQIRQWDGPDRTVAAEAPLGSDAWHAAKLALSPRPHEMLTTPGANGRTLQAFVVYPHIKEKAPVVMMIPEDQGLNNWARDMADQIAAMGYIVLVPDMLSGYGPGGGGRSTFPDIKSVFMAFSSLPAHEDLMLADLNAWGDYAKTISQSNGKLAVVGFAWGGGRAFWFATQRKDLSAAFVFYDAGPPAEALAGITAPVYGFYAENDSRVTKSLDATKAAMAAAGKKYEPIMYPGTQHMFVRLGDEPGNTNAANLQARYESLDRLQKLLKAM